MRQKGWLYGLMICSMVMLLIVSACGNENTNNNSGTSASGTSSSSSSSTANNASDSSDTSKLEPVELHYYYTGSPQKDLKMVEDAMNVILKEKINATVKLNQVDWGNYEQKMNLMNSSGEYYDLAFTAPWMNNYYDNITRQTLIPLDELLEKYAPKTKASIPDKIWEAARVDGKIYGVINYQIVALQYGVSIRKNIADKIGFDVSTIKKIADVEPYLEKIKTQLPDVTQPMVFTAAGDSFNGQPQAFGMDAIGGNSDPGWVYLNDGTKVVNQYESPEYKEFVELMHRWYQKGYINKDALNITDLEPDRKAGRLGISIGESMKPGQAEAYKASYGEEIILHPLTEGTITTGGAIATMTGISSTSKNPERAMMFLELLNTDKELFNIFAKGIEGVHYEFVDKEKGVIGPPSGMSQADVGYNPNTDWMYGNQFNAYYVAMDQVGTYEQTIALNESAKSSPIVGFSFNSEPVKTDLAQVSAVIGKYQVSLISGLADPAVVLPEFLAKLKDAGVDRIIAEKQKQLDEFFAGKK